MLESTTLYVAFTYTKRFGLFKTNKKTIGPYNDREQFEMAMQEYVDFLATINPDMIIHAEYAEIQVSRKVRGLDE